MQSEEMVESENEELFEKSVLLKRKELFVEDITNQQSLNVETVFVTNIIYLLFGVFLN